MPVGGHEREQFTQAEASARGAFMHGSMMSRVPSWTWHGPGAALGCSPGAAGWPSPRAPEEEKPVRAQGRQMGRISLAFLSETRVGSVSLRADCMLFYS